MAKSSIRDFDVLTRLGKGGFGTVFKVRRKADNNTYVLKLVSLEDLSLKGQQAAVNEVHLLASLNHPYVVKYYDSFLDKKTLHIVMEYCDKGDLDSLIRMQMGRPILETKVWKLFLQICMALEYLHSHRILHRDIKPMNVFLARNDAIRVGDLGVAKRMGHSSAFAHTAVGTPYYLSPELCEDKPYNVKSDVWALGCVLYEMCMLKHPFEASNQGALYLKIVRASYAPVPALYSPELREIVDLCLCKDYKKRPSVITILSRPGIREKALGLNVRIPESSVLSDVPLNIPPSPSTHNEVPVKRDAQQSLPPLAGSAESEKKAEKSFQRPVSRQSALKPQRGNAERIRMFSRPSSVFESQRSSEYLQDIQEVANLPDYVGKPQAQPSSAAAPSEEKESIRTEPWKPVVKTLNPVQISWQVTRPNSPPVASPRDILMAKKARLTTEPSDTDIAGKEIPAGEASQDIATLLPCDWELTETVKEATRCAMKREDVEDELSVCETEKEGAEALEERLRELMASVTTKTTELISLLSPKVFLEVYSYLQSALNATEEPDQETLDAFTAAKVPAVHLHTVSLFYIIITHQLEIKAIKKELRTLNAELV